MAVDSHDSSAKTRGDDHGGAFVPHHQADSMTKEERDAAIAASIPKKTPKAALAVDGEWGAATTSALQAVLGVAVDGVFGPDSARALQSKLGVEADGDFGANSARALQGYLGVGQDGDIGPATVTAMQNRLNAGTF